jgi:hypothetical protein
MERQTPQTDSPFCREHCRLELTVEADILLDEFASLFSNEDRQRRWIASKVRVAASRPSSDGK